MGQWWAGPNEPYHRSAAAAVFASAFHQGSPGKPAAVARPSHAESLCWKSPPTVPDGCRAAASYTDSHRTTQAASSTSSGWKYNSMMAMTSSRVIWSEAGGCSPGGSVVAVVVVVVVGGAVVVVVVGGAVVVVGGAVVVVVVGGRASVVVVAGTVVVEVVEVVEVVDEGDVVVVATVDGGGTVVVVGAGIVVVATASATVSGIGSSGAATSPPTTHIAPPARKSERSRSKPRSWVVTTRKRYCRPYHCAMSRPRLVLASSSPRRRDLLGVLGLSFAVEAPQVDESPRDGETPARLVERVALDKARAVHRPGTATLSADTVVVLDDDVLTKPASEADAAAMLRRLRGRTHLVHTGVALTTDAGDHSTVATTAVTLAPIEDEVIAWYVATGEPLDKAGSYALQGVGGVFVDHIEGDPFNVIGLPLAITRDLFRRAGLDLLAFRSS